MKAWTRYITATCFSILGAAIYGLKWAESHGGGPVGGMTLIVLFFLALIFAIVNLPYFLPGTWFAKIRYIILSLPLMVIVMYGTEWKEWNKDITTIMLIIAVSINCIFSIYFFFRQLKEDHRKLSKVNNVT